MIFLKMNKMKYIKDKYLFFIKPIKIADHDYNEDNMHVNRVRNFSFTRWFCSFILMLIKIILKAKDK